MMNNKRKANNSPGPQLEDESSSSSQEIDRVLSVRKKLKKTSTHTRSVQLPKKVIDFKFFLSLKQYSSFYSSH